VVPVIEALPSGTGSLLHNLYDTNSTPAVALQAYRDAVSGGAHAVLGPARSVTATAVANYAASNSDAIPLLSYWATATELTTDRRIATGPRTVASPMRC
jgi:hypothetical protein